jgi:hypothetical protein
MYKEFSVLPKIGSLINLLIKLQITCFEKVITEYSVLRSTVIIIDGYIEQHKDITLFGNSETVQQFRDWVGSTVSQNIKK